MKVKPPHVEQLHAVAAGRGKAPPTRVVDTPPNNDRMRLEQIRTCPCPGFSLVRNTCRLVRQYDTLFMGLIDYMIGGCLICLEKSILKKFGFQQVQHVRVKCQSEQEEHQK